MKKLNLKNRKMLAFTLIFAGILLLFAATIIAGTAFAKPPCETLRNCGLIIG